MTIPARLRYPQTTVRWKLTLLYGGLFLICGGALLGITYTLVSHAEGQPVAGFQLANFPPNTVRTFTARPRPVQVRVNGAIPAPKGALPAPLRHLSPEARKLLFSSAGGQVVRAVGVGQRISDLHQLELWSGIALAIMAVISGLLGWIVSGRVLRPLRTITAATQKISEANLHERLALPGPRDELGKLADTIDGLLERLEGAFDAQRRFVANASHELRTPLTSARALLEMAISDPNATLDTFRRTCRHALEENEHQERLIDALLALAQGQRGIDQREEIELATLTGAVLRAQDLDAAASGLRVDASLEPAVIAGDRRLIERLVSNLVENAIRHNVPSGQLEVRVSASPGQAVLRVANTGSPVPEDEVERLLQPFHRLAQDRVGRDGLGLGLSIVAAITNAHDANLDIRPREHGGLRVEVRFMALLRESDRAIRSEPPSQLPAPPTAYSPART